VGYAPGWPGVAPGTPPSVALFDWIYTIGRLATHRPRPTHRLVGIRVGEAKRPGPTGPQGDSQGSSSRRRALSEPGADSRGSASSDKKPRLEDHQSEKLKSLLRYGATPIKIQIGTKFGHRLNLSLSAVGKSGGGYRARWQTQSFKLEGIANRWTSSDRDTAEEALVQWTNLYAGDLDEVTLHRLDEVLQRAGTPRIVHSTGPLETPKRETGESRHNGQEGEETDSDQVGPQSGNNSDSSPDPPRQAEDSPGLLPPRWAQAVWEAADEGRLQTPPLRHQVPFRPPGGTPGGA
jgi:hypothetical protein